MNSNLPDKVQKYLSKYGSTKWKIISGDEKYDCAIVIPAIAEYKNTITLLDSLSENTFDNAYHLLVIFVVNNTNSSSKEVKENNQKSLELLKAIFIYDLSYHPIIKKINSSKFSVGYVDASSDGFEMPEKTGGVGLARKIGMDLALTVFDYSKKEKRILVCLDADCTIEKNYISEIIDSFNTLNMNTAVINYEHPLNERDENLQGIICYEIFLRYYELGLIYAGSHYAFQTVGSAMACDYEAYIKIEGMNNLKAAEDFYFLEKMAKHYKICKINSTKVFPSSRKSWRVPFGTGQRINRFHSKVQNEFLLYNPEGFNILKQWLELYNSEKSMTSDDYLQMSNNIHPELCKFLIGQNFKNACDKIVTNSKDGRQLRLQKLRWFDGFRTLKLLHHLRDTAFPLLNMFDALDDLFEKMNIQHSLERNKYYIPEIHVQKEYLFVLRNYLKNNNKNDN